LGALALAIGAQADVYMHSFRGSNNRLDEANRDRANANRLFDSQNNNRGGYNVGSVYYMQGSKAYFQWTNQHSCGAANNDCEIVLQYMCDDLLRDGTSTNRIPDNNMNCYNYDCETDLEYGRQESMDHWYTCSATHRNKGLFIANQNLKGNDARYTRQNPNANRYGYECAEERDYYPYWKPSPWVDMAIITNDPTRCAAYQAASENVVGRSYCKVPTLMYEQYKMENRRGWIPITQEECEQIFWLDVETQTNTFATWVTADPHNAPAPECIQAKWTRDNHLGNIVGGYMASYNWTVGDFEHEQCAFRIRYNITTSEYAAWEDDFSVQVGAIDHKNNSDFFEPDRHPANLAIWETYHVDYSEVMDSFDRSLNGNQATLTGSREYVFKNNPKVDLFGTLLPAGLTGSYNLKLQMNINTNQFGRTFQDRSHRFAVRPASDECRGTTIHNLQVRGKRGNIVQTFPGMEYDFVPDRLDIQSGECVHIQWTGSNTNPNNNAGQGKQGTDRSNMVLLANPVYFEEGQDQDSYTGQFGRSFPTDIRATSFLGLSDEDEQKLALLEPHFGGELSELDDAGTYFDLGARKVSVTGIYHYLCTRNNNFSNRSQKGKIVSSVFSSNSAVIGWEGGTAASHAQTESVTIVEGTFTSAVDISIVSWPPTNSEKNKHNIVSNYVQVVMSEEGPFTLAINYDDLWSVNGHALFFNPDTGASNNLNDNGWREVGAKFNNGVATKESDLGSGVYVVTEGPVDLALAIILPLLTVGLLGGGLYAYKKHKAGEKVCAQL
jgi:hypothetical protein